MSTTTPILSLVKAEDTDNANTYVKTNIGANFDTLDGALIRSVTNTLTSSGRIDMSAASTTAGLKLPSAAGAVPTTAGVLAYDSTANALVYGNGSTTRTAASVAGTETLTNKTLTSPTINAATLTGTVTNSSTFTTLTSSGTGSNALTLSGANPNIDATEATGQVTLISRRTAANAGTGIALQTYNGSNSLQNVLQIDSGTSTPGFKISARLQPSTDALAAQTAAALFAGSGAPNNANGQNGDYYFRSDGSSSTTHIYFRTGGSWTGIA
jgi:hypothetical protein